MINEHSKYEFMRRLLLGKTFSAEDKAIKLAYDDVKRTFRYHGEIAYPATNAASNMIKMFLQQIRALIEVMDGTESFERIAELYDASLIRACQQIMDSFNDCNFECHFGQAQKWVNMTMKYLTIFTSDYDKIVPYMHVPIDNIIYDVVDTYGIKRPNEAWSRMTLNKYIKYQESIKNYVKDNFNKYPIEWEYDSWMENNKNINE